MSSKRQDGSLIDVMELQPQPPSQSQSQGQVSVVQTVEPALSTYTDFRAYLQDVYQYRRVKQSGSRRPYNYAAFAAAADIKSPHYLKLIIDGRRNLSDEMIGKFAKALKLTRSETEEFRVLVMYGQSTDPMRRNRYLKELADIRSKNALRPQATFGAMPLPVREVHSKTAHSASGSVPNGTQVRETKSNPSTVRQDDQPAPETQRKQRAPGWIGWVLYAMADQAGVDFDPDALYRLFRIKTSPDEIRSELLKMLESGGLIEVPEEDIKSSSEEGTDFSQPLAADGNSLISDENRELKTQIRKGRNVIESPQDLPVETIRKLQSELIYLGIESLFRDSPKEREFGAMTMAMTQQEFEMVRFELRQLRKRLHKNLLVNRESSKGERVYQMNIQLFPVTEKVTSSGKD